MKLSEVKGERTFEVIADLVEPIANLAEDKAVMAFFEKKQCPKGKTAREFTIERIRKALPALMRDHKDDIVLILSTIEGVTTEEYTSNLNMAKLMGDVYSLVTDEEFLSFLS
jgi:electron transfer flavoprotein alpha subunit